MRIATPPGPAEIGYWLAPPYWRRGLMSEAISTVATDAFEQCDAVSISDEVFTANHASARLLERLGFRNVETLPGHHEQRGTSIDCYHNELPLSRWGEHLS